MKCPGCGSKYFKESRQCPLYEGESVCINCCQNCEFYSLKGFITCGFYIQRKGNLKDKRLAKKKELLTFKKELTKYQDTPQLADYLKNKIENLEVELNR